MTGAVPAWHQEATAETHTAKLPVPASTKYTAHLLDGNTMKAALSNLNAPTKIIYTLTKVVQEADATVQPIPAQTKETPATTSFVTKLAITVPDRIPHTSLGGLKNLYLQKVLQTTIVMMEKTTTVTASLIAWKDSKNLHAIVRKT